MKDTMKNFFSSDKKLQTSDLFQKEHVSLIVLTPDINKVDKCH